MKKQLSVFYLASRQSFYKIIALMAASGTFQYFFFQNELNALRNTSTSTVTSYRDLERVISLSAINVIFAITVICVLFLLSVTGTSFGSKCGYTLKRLSVSERTYFYIQSLYNLIMLIALLAFEIALTYIFADRYMAFANESYISSQTIFLAYYRNEFLHSVLPLSDTLIWIRNVLQMLTLSLSASFFSYKQRRGRRSIAVIFLAVFSIIWNSGEIGGSISVILSYLICLCMIGYIVTYVKNGWGENDEYVD